MKGPKKLVVRVVASIALAFGSIVAGAGAAQAQTITTADCLAGGGTVVDHGAWQGCRGISPHDIKIVD